MHLKTDADDTAQVKPTDMNTELIKDARQMMELSLATAEKGEKIANNDFTRWYYRGRIDALTHAIGLIKIVEG